MVLCYEAVITLHYVDVYSTSFIVILLLWNVLTNVTILYNEYYYVTCGKIP